MSILASSDTFHLIANGAAQPSGLLAALRAPLFIPPALLESHLSWWIAAAAVGGVLIFVARQRADARLLRAGQITLVATLLWIIAAQTFITAGERLYNAHSAMAAAADKGDVDSIVTYIDPTFVAPDLGETAINKENVRTILSDVFKTLSPKDVKITAYKMDLQPDGSALSRITVYTKLEMGPTSSTWQLSWRDVPGADWRMFAASNASGQKLPENIGESLKP